MQQVKVNLPAVNNGRTLHNILVPGAITPVCPDMNAGLARLDARVEAVEIRLGCVGTRLGIVEIIEAR